MSKCLTASLFCLCLCFKLASTYRVQLVNAHGLFWLTTLRCWLSAGGSKRVWKKFIKQSKGMFSFSFPERESLTRWVVDLSCQYRGMSDEWWVMSRKNTRWVEQLRPSRSCHRRARWWTSFQPRDHHQSCRWNLHVQLRKWLVIC